MQKIKSKDTPAARDAAGTIAVTVCAFRDEAAMHAAFASPQTVRVMADVKVFTDVAPTRWQAAPI
jgi:hypothetical protein